MGNNILFVAPQIPYPPNHGSSIRNFNLIRILAERNTVDLLAFAPPDYEPSPENPLYEMCRNVAVVPQPTRANSIRILDTVRRRLPDMALRLESVPMRQLVQQWVVDNRQQNQYDIVQLEGIEVAQYGLAILDTFQSDREQTIATRQPVLFFDDHNCEYLLQKRNALNDLSMPRRWPAALYSLVQWYKLKWYEALICKRADAVTVVSPGDKEALETLVDGIDVTVVSNGITLDAYESNEHPSNEQQEMDSTPQLTLRPKKLIFVGKMDYRPNIDAVLWFADQVLPLIQAKEPTVLFEIVGMNPHSRLEPLSQRAGIEILGKVDEIPPYLHAASAYVIPLRVGGGTRFKALEAMAARMPIVSTRLGVEGIPVAHERELLLADTPETFANEVLRLLADDPQAEALRQRLGSTGRRFVEAHYSWQTIVPKLEETYARILLN